MGSLKMINLVVIDDQRELIIYHTVIPQKRQAVWYFRKCKTINWKTTRNWLSNGGDTRETSVTTNIPENESIQFTLGDNHQLLDEADHDVKNCTDRAYCYPSAKLDKSPQALHTSSHFRMIVLLSYLGHRLSLKLWLFLGTVSGYSRYTVNSWQLEAKSISPGFSSYISLNFSDYFASRFYSLCKTTESILCLYFFSFQLKFSVHSCILRCLIAFPPHQFAYLLISVYIVCFKLPITRTLHNSNFFFGFPRRFE